MQFLSNMKESKKEIAYRQIKEEIIRNNLQPGTLLAERRICELLNTSRTPVREALQQLIVEGLVEHIPGKGTFVSSITYEDINEIYDVREVLEGLACRLCALQIDDVTLQRMEELLVEFDDAVKIHDMELCLAKDFEFHDCIIDSANNGRLRQSMNFLIDQRKRMASVLRNEERAILAAKNHRDIFAALKDRDADGAENLMREHVRINKEYHLDIAYPSRTSRFWL